MAARMRFNQDGGQKDANTPTKPVRSSRDGEAGVIMGLKVFVIVNIETMKWRNIRERTGGEGLDIL
jgi:hypothetical protein